MSLRTARCATGFTLIELMVCIGIIMVLAGIVYVNLGPVRERARETRCLNNFRQIGLALQMKRGAPAPMYRQDYGGSDPPGATTVAALGLPYGPRGMLALRRNYLRSPDVFRCQSVYWPPEMSDMERAPTDLRSDYFWMVVPEDWPSDIPAWIQSEGLRMKFSDWVTRRGLDTPLMADVHHGSFFRNTSPPPHLLLVLRLSGQVQRVRTASGDSWRW